MDLDELKQAWAQMQLRIDRLERRQSLSALRATWLRLWTAQAVWIALVVASAVFWSGHLERPPLVVADMP